MSRPPGGRRPTDPFKAAEAAFKKATTKPVEGPAQAPAIPGVKESITLRIDQDVLEYFQQDGPGWQDRINAALRKVAGK
ncbi:BrnA antitoxin family protein [Microvirga soli]|uniref:BrnA antitoxin family protein n=1 Tax=Microvirga soli TaxID=1854496 RepID=UPI0019203442|nr:BrnA antitoxin family protein [Microvirga soli]